MQAEVTNIEREYKLSNVGVNKFRFGANQQLSFSDLFEKLHPPFQPYHRNENISKAEILQKRSPCVEETKFTNN